MSRRGVIRLTHSVNGLIVAVLAVSAAALAGDRWGNTKPPAGAWVNWSHPLARGLVGCWFMNENGGNRLYSPCNPAYSAALFALPTMWTWQGGGVLMPRSTSGGWGIAGQNLPLDSDNWTLCIKMRRWTGTAATTERLLSWGGGGPTLYYSEPFAGGFGLVHGGTIDISSTATTPNGSDFTFCATRSRSTARLIVNGQVVATNAAFGVAFTNGPFIIGNSDAANEPTGGIVDLALAYSRGLSVEEIRWVTAQPFAVLTTSLPIGLRWYSPR